MYLTNRSWMRLTLSIIVSFFLIVMQAWFITQPIYPTTFKIFWCVPGLIVGILWGAYNTTEAITRITRKK